MKNEISIKEIKGKVDFGIITIREDEFEAVLKRFPTKKFAKGRQTYAISYLQNSNDDEYVIASVRCPEQGNAQGQSVAQKLIDELDPQWILLVGIAGSVPDNEYTLGDVLLATRLYDFCVSASIESETRKQEFNIKGGQMMPEIQSLLAALPALEPYLEKWYTPRKIIAQRPKVKITPANFYGDDSWINKVKESLKRYFGNKSIRSVPKAFTGSIASSDTLVKDTKLAQQWQQSARQFSGIEMELSGVYQAAWESHKPVLAIRGISDVVGFKRSPDWTSYACHSAAAFTLALLKSRPINPRIIKSDDESKIAERTDETYSSDAHPVSAFKSIPVNVPALHISEKLFSNLLEVKYFPEKLNVVRTTCKSRSEVWGILNSETGKPPEDWVYNGYAIYAFHEFDDPMWKNIIDSEPNESHSTSRWSHSKDIKETNIFIELLKGCLKELALTRELVYRHKKPLRFLYYAPTEDLSPRRVVTKSLKREAPHTVFKAYNSFKSGEIMYYRHHAFRFEFEFIDEKWFLQITPTYHYTWNGKQLYRYYEDQIKGIKRQENNEAVFRQVLFWSEVLSDDESNFLQQNNKYPFLQFGKLLDFRFPYGVLDSAWQSKESAESKKSRNQRNTLFS